jgi:hypothetical protein
VSEGFRNFTNAVTALAAFGGVVIAALGLLTWKDKIKWEQGRGLAKSLLVSANKVRTLARSVKSEFHFLSDGNANLEDQEERHDSLAKRVEKFVLDFDEAINDFEQYTVEAKLLWKASFREPISEFRDVSHTIRSYLYSGLRSVDPRAKHSARHASVNDHSDFHPKIYGHDSIYKQLEAIITDVEKITAEKLPK